MKRILLGTLLLITVLAFTLDSSSSLPRDANREAVQTGKNIQLYDATATAVTSPVTSATTVNQTLTIPTNAVELTINPNSGTLKYESYSDTTRFYQFDTIQTFPCSGVDSLKISNDSGSSVTWSFYFNML